MTQAPTAPPRTRAQISDRTLRKDAWRRQPAVNATALGFNRILIIGAAAAVRDHSGGWGHMVVGTLVLLVNAALLWLYSLSCHACRHITGGWLMHFSRHPVRYRMWTLLSRLNSRHME